MMNIDGTSLTHMTDTAPGFARRLGWLLELLVMRWAELDQHMDAVAPLGL